MKELIVNTVNVLDKVEDTFDNIIDITEELDTAKLAIDMSTDNTPLTAKARIYRNSLLKLGIKKMYTICFLYFHCCSDYSCFS